MTPKDEFQHAFDMTFTPGYAAAFYMTIMHNETMKSQGKTMIPFDPKRPNFHLDEAQKNDPEFQEILRRLASASRPRKASGKL